METLRSLLNKPSFKGFLAALGIVIVVCLLARAATASEPTPKERAAARLPAVLREKEDTKPAYDRHVKALGEEKAILLCLQTDDCSDF